MTESQSSLISKFITWYFNDFQQLPEYQLLQTCVENSPWHRETNVATHTNMVVFHAMDNFKDLNISPIYVLLAAAFHDFGKPAARTEKFSEERGVYYSYPGHEQISSRIWEDVVCRHWKEWSTLFNLKLIDIYKIGWLIQYHLPFGISKTETRKRLMYTDFALHGELTQLLMADTFGRISDDQDNKRKSTIDWCWNFTQKKLELCTEQYTKTDYMISVGNSANEPCPTLVVPIAPSGSGKGTFYMSEQLSSCFSNTVLNTDYFSMDELRHEFYNKDDYTDAFKQSCEDNTFSSRVNKRLIQLLNNKQNLYADNTNLTKKSRKMILSEAKKRGYRTVAVLFPLSQDIILEHQKNRTDKFIHDGVFQAQYSRVQLPSLGEFDEIRVINSGLN